jgi:hypothetical protein
MTCYEKCFHRGPSGVRLSGLLVIRKFAGNSVNPNVFGNALDHPL